MAEEIKPSEAEAKTVSAPISTGITLTKQPDGRMHVVLLYNTDTVALTLDLGPHEDAMNHVPLSDGIRQACAAARREESGITIATNLDDIPAAFRRRG